MPDQPYRGIETIQLFKRYQSPQQYVESTGKLCPPFDVKRPPKYWQDDFTSAEYKTIAGKVVLYHQTLAMAGYHAAVGTDGKPYMEPLILQKTDAASVNIPEPGGMVTEDVQPEVPIPCRPLKETEEFVFMFGGVPAIKDLTVEQPVSGSGFTELDRVLLVKIAKALGIS